MEKVGQYKVSLHHGSWAIYRITHVSDMGYSMQPVLDEPEFPYDRRDDAIRRMYQLNGWEYRPR